MTILVTVKAIYIGGVLKPVEPLALSENQRVSLELTPLPTSETPTGCSLFGAFPELAALNGEDFT